MQPGALHCRAGAVLCLYRKRGEGKGRIMLSNLKRAMLNKMHCRLVVRACTSTSTTSFVPYLRGKEGEMYVCT